MRSVSTGLVCAAGATLLLLGFAGATQAPSASKASEADVKFFETKIRPLLADNCFACHGDAKQMGGLRLDSAQALLKGGAHGVIVAAGDPEKSRLIQAVRYTGDLKMPPAGKLSDAAIAALSDWVKRGAPWPEAAAAKPVVATPEMHPTPEQRAFWSFQPVRHPPVPEVRNPKSKIQNPIDAFILAELEKKGLPPAPRADKRTLIRRATFDLTGLPPTPAEVSAFLADHSADAYDRLVDRLLASPRYGERWARHWLDLVRYCDSLDSRSLGAPGDIGEAWRYRDWVVDALNKDYPYNEFLMDQIAGDLRPAKNPAQFNRDGLIASTMLAIGNWGNGDADKEKVHTDIVDDQIDVISRSFMGLTIGCARCHNHKFDPISQKDYYGLAGFFFSTHILAKFTPKGAGEDIMRTPIASPAELAARRAHSDRLADLEKRVAASDDTRRMTIAKTLQPEAARYLLAAWDYHNRPKEQESLSLAAFAQQKGLREFAVRQWLDFVGLGGYRVMSLAAKDILGAPGVFAWKTNADTPSAVINTNAEAKSLLTFTLPPRSVCVHPGPKTGVAVAWRSPITGEILIDGGVKDVDPACGDGIAWKLQVASAGGARELASGDIPNGGAQAFGQAPTAATLRAVTVRSGDIVEALVLPKNGHECDTTAITLTIEQVGSNKKWDLAADMMEDPLAGNPHKDRLGNQAVWSFLDMATGGASALQGPLAGAMSTWRDAASRPESTDQDRAAAAAKVGAAFSLADSNSPFWPSNPADLAGFEDPNRDANARLARELEEERKVTFPPLEYANAAQDGGIPETPYAGFHDARVHIRGSYARLGELVPRHFPTILAGDNVPHIENGSGRLELAKWIASDTHPLTARVIVNRLWQHHFGEGIVRTPSNFGFLGERPSNQPLLDWLASEFVKNGWSLKKMHRLIMTSATYQQASTASQLAQRLDPDNRLFGRQNRQRLEAEAIRDSLLAVSGKLDAKMGGPAVRDFATPRRSIYVITIRSDRTGFGPLFDVADTTALVDRRTVSIVAPQALFLMNNPFALDQAKALAAKLKASAANDEARIGKAYDLLFGRPPTGKEVEIGRRLLGSSRTTRDSEIPGSVATDTSEENWEAYCQVLLCSNEFMFVD